MAHPDKNQPAEGTVPSVEELASRLVDLWQEQLTAMAANPDLAGQMARLMAALPLPGMWLGQMAQAGLAAGTPTDWWKGSHGFGTPFGSQSGFAPAGSATAGSATAGPASGPGGNDMAELVRRLAGLERRLAELDAKSGGKRAAGTSRKPPRRTRAKSRKN